MNQADIETWNPKRPVQWARLPDSELKAFGAVDSLTAASHAITAYMSPRAGGRTDALALAYDSVIGPESADGVVHLDALLPYFERVALGLGDEPASVGDQVACAFGILAASRQGDTAPSEELLARTHRRLSELLLEHPVLLHPRLVLPIRMPRSASVKHMSLFTAMVFTGAAQLPSERHGIDEQRLSRFAKSALIMAPIVRSTPRRALALGDGLRESVILEYRGVTLTNSMGMRGNLHAELLASLLEIGRLRGKDDQWPGRRKRVLADSNVLASIIAAIPRALGINETRVGKSGASVVRSRTCEQFIEELVRSELLHDTREPDGHAVASVVVQRLPLAIQRSVLHSDGNAPSLAPASAMPAWVAEENTATQLALLQKVGLAKDGVGAAEWLHRQLIAGGDDGKRALPFTSTDQAFGLLSALAATGMTIPEAPPTNVNEKGAFKGLVSVHDAWATAHGIVSRQQAMERAMASSMKLPKSAESRRHRGVGV